MIIRRTTRQIRLGDLLIGGGAPISVQSMTNTDTADTEKTAEQIRLTPTIEVREAELWCGDNGTMLRFLTAALAAMPAAMTARPCSGRARCVAPVPWHSW